MIANLLDWFTRLKVPWVVGHPAAVSLEQSGWRSLVCLRKKPRNAPASFVWQAGFALTVRLFRLSTVFSATSALRTERHPGGVLANRG
jgi:hypothetical protein